MSLKVELQRVLNDSAPSCPFPARGRAQPPKSAPPGGGSVPAGGASWGLVENRWLTPRELAWVMNVSPSTVEDWVRRQVLPSFKFGRMRRFAPGDVAEFARRYTVRGKAK